MTRRGRTLAGELLFERGGRPVPIGGGMRVKPGRMVLLELGHGRARVAEDLGRPEVAAQVVDALLRENGMGTGFPRPVEEEAAAAVDAAAKLDVERRDLTGMATFTVDPASARDFDDAVSASESGDGIRLWIHIADVAAHVRPGGALEKEARRRGNSTYVPGTVEPMLPHVLSSEACSLTPQTERLAVTTEVELDPDGAPRSASFYRSRIRSDARLNYDQLDEIFAGRHEPPAEVAEPLRLARRAAAALAERRAGSQLEVTTAEPDFEFTAEGDVRAAHAVPQTEAHRLIEQLMVLTNERVAELCERKGIPTLYRVHEQPDGERIERLVEQLDALEVPTPPLPKGAISPSQAGKLVVEASRLVAKEAARRGHGAAAYTSLVLRSLSQAHYADKNLGHAGLGSPAYAHFTSPIRRFPDLVCHRALLSAVGRGERAPRAESLADEGVHCSERERNASKLERRADDVCGAFLLTQELAERGPDSRFEGEVSGVIEAGAFVRFGGALADVYEGFLPARSIGGRERYELDPTETMLLGGSGGHAVRLGDPIRVKVEAVEPARGRVDLAEGD